MRSFCSGATRAKTRRRAHALAQRRVVERRDLGAGRARLAGRQPGFARDRARRRRVVAGDHHDADAGGAALGDRVRHVRAQRIGEGRRGPSQVEVEVRADSPASARRVSARAPRPARAVRRRPSLPRLARDLAPASPRRGGRARRRPRARPSARPPRPCAAAPPDVRHREQLRRERVLVDELAALGRACAVQRASPRGRAAPFPSGRRAGSRSRAPPLRSSARSAGRACRRRRHPGRRHGVAHRRRTRATRTVIRFSVSVPVLSTHRTVAAPSVSITPMRRVSTCRREMRQAPGGHEHREDHRKFLGQDAHRECECLRARASSGSPARRPVERGHRRSTGRSRRRPRARTSSRVSPPQRALRLLDRRERAADLSHLGVDARGAHARDAAALHDHRARVHQRQRIAAGARQASARRRADRPPGAFGHRHRLAGQQRLVDARSCAASSTRVRGDAIALVERAGCRRARRRGRATIVLSASRMTRARGLDRSRSASSTRSVLRSCTIVMPITMKMNASSSSASADVAQRQVEHAGGDDHERHRLGRDTGRRGADRAAWRRRQLVVPGRRRGAPPPRAASARDRR